MKLGKTLYARDRAAWRRWLAKNAGRAPRRAGGARELPPLSASYRRRIRLGFIEGARRRPAELRRRLRHFVRRTAKNERYGMLRSAALCMADRVRRVWRPSATRHATWPASF